MSVKYKIRDQHGLNYLTGATVGWVDLFTRQVYRDMVLESWRYCRRDWLLHLFGYHAYNKKHKQTYQVWQHDNHPVELYTEPVIAQKMNYIHDNAVEAGYVILPEHWLYSSAAYYAAIADDKFCEYQPLIEISPVGEWFFG